MLVVKREEEVVGGCKLVINHVFYPLLHPH